MEPILLGTIISGIANVVGTIFTNEKNLSEAKAAEERARQRYLEDREYASIANQIKRLKAEGKNPAYYLKGDTVTSPQSFQMSVPQAQAPDFGAIVKDVITNYSMTMNEKRAEIKSMIEQGTFETNLEVIQQLLETRDQQLDILAQQYLQAVEQTKQEIIATETDTTESIMKQRELEVFNREQEIYDRLNDLLKIANKGTLSGFNDYAKLALQLTANYLRSKSKKGD